MKYLNNKYVEVKYKRCIIHPTENVIERLRDPLKSPRTQNQIKIKQKSGRIKKLSKKANNELEAKKG